VAVTPLSFESFNAASTQSGDSAQYVIVEPNFGGINEYDDVANSSSGSWTAAPEIDPASAASGLTLRLGGLAVLRGRRPGRQAA
jgi:hypothetical protein